MKRNLIVTNKYITEQGEHVRIECFRGNVEIYLEDECVYRQSIIDLIEILTMSAKQLLNNMRVTKFISLLGTRVILGLSEYDIYGDRKVEMMISYELCEEKLHVDFERVKNVISKYITLAMED